MIRILVKVLKIIYIVKLMYRNSEKWKETWKKYKKNNKEKIKESNRKYYFKTKLKRKEVKVKPIVKLVKVKPSEIPRVKVINKPIILSFY